MKFQKILFVFQTYLKAGNKSVTEIGSLTCSLDTPQQGLDMIESAILMAVGEESAPNIQIALNLSATELYDNVEFFIGYNF